MNEENKVMNENAEQIPVKMGLVTKIGLTLDQHKAEVKADKQAKKDAKKAEKEAQKAEPKKGCPKWIKTTGKILAGAAVVVGGTLIAVGAKKPGTENEAQTDTELPPFEEDNVSDDVQNDTIEVETE